MSDSSPPASSLSSADSDLPPPLPLTGCELSSETPPPLPAAVVTPPPPPPPTFSAASAPPPPVSAPSPWPSAPPPPPPVHAAAGMAVPGVVGEWMGKLKALWASNPKAVIGAAVVIFFMLRGFGGSDRAGTDSGGGGSGGPGNPPSLAEITASMKKLLTTRSGSGVFNPSSIIVHEARVSPRLVEFAGGGQVRRGYPCQIRWSWIFHKKSTDPAFHYNKVSEYFSTDAKASWDDFGVLTMHSLDTLTPESERQEPYTEPLE